MVNQSQTVSSPGPSAYSLGTDYMGGAHPRVLEALANTNLLRTPGYGGDSFCGEAAALIRQACRAPKAGVRFLVGGTQTNMVALSSLLAPYQGVIAAETGHISGHEAGAIEAGGHKVLALPAQDGKLTAQAIAACWKRWEQDETREHVVMPGAVYLSQPTESGTLYSLAELTAIHRVCRKAGMALYVDGARLAYALACPANDVGLADLAALCDGFYIGGTKCGALFGEALVFPQAGRIPHFFSLMKQKGAVLAKGRLLGVQFKALFTEDLYGTIGRAALTRADQLREGLRSLGYTPLGSSPTNQVFIHVSAPLYHQLIDAGIGGFWSLEADGSYIIRFVTDWSTEKEEIDRLLALLPKLA